ncbi:MAG: hypothetical protein QGF90_03815 [Gammaproteobacteria bacterium]|jgi:hypothetical protein|nr:hypothetical protein [Gammaproteobacteria bacterium]
MSIIKEIGYVQQKLSWMRAQKIWPNGLRYLWTDAFGIVVLVSLYEALGDEDYLAQAELLVAEVDRHWGVNAVFESERKPIVMGSISTTLPCGCMHSPYWPGTFLPTDRRESIWFGKFTNPSCFPAAAYTGR